MSVITVFSGTFCKEEGVVKEVSFSVGCRLVTDEEIVAKASAASTIGETKIRRAFSSKTSVFNKFTREKERSIAHLRLALAETISEDKLLISGFVGH
ncbi:MAG: response regulator, partial [Desulfobacterales bacterium]|nr:response regulator [Desulfobacterales bacterium]